MTNTDHLLFASKELLRSALQTNGARIITHGFGANQADVGFEIHGRNFCLELKLTEVGEMKIAPLRQYCPRRALANSST
jgi:hypothetical protein